MKKNTKIICGFAGIGKSDFINIRKDLTIIDSDSSQFAWIDKSIRNPIKNPDFPNNYMVYIKENIGKVDIIFVSNNIATKEALKGSGIDYILVYPSKSEKKEYMNRYENQDKKEDFIRHMDKRWDKAINGMNLVK